ncbi:unnamed protein product [Pleuronectes platessa]|uniref:Uncharacterized protein n=1 Tax=Pleuronectes platessa TaxID=8262 RepID=A0A9N7YZ51_PLEPL|nr:unnamed protein product [Pleuronectes platessa]
MPEVLQGSHHLSFHPSIHPSIHPSSAADLKSGGGDSIILQLILGNPELRSLFITLVGLNRHIPADTAERRLSLSPSILPSLMAA